MSLPPEQLERYNRNIAIGEVGEKGQERLLKSKVLIVGAGGLGSSCSLYLAAAGIGTLTIIDSDKVDLSNLQRQILYFTQDIDSRKVDSARQKINMLNPDIKVITHHERVGAHNIRDFIEENDFVIDASDNFSAKFLINDACVLMEKPYSHAGVIQFGGQTLTYTPGCTCYRCIFESPPPEGTYLSPAEAGILGSVAGLVGTIQATEAIKFLLGIGDLLTNKLLIYDGYTMSFNSVDIEKNDNCPICGRNPTITELINC
ncbi:MAG: ThiF family adenylyltransferase [Spirochaetota bacterium]|nr:MAG: ThiF family adenylyltransferase [Spirochaetota bacterium]